MFRVVVFTWLCCLCTANVSFAADLPLIFDKAPPVYLKHKPQKTVHAQKIAVNAKTPNSIPTVVAALPLKTKPSADVMPALQAPETTSNLSWVLAPMSANADGGKHEGSASAKANIVVDKPGSAFGPYVVIELEGHVVKTLQSTARIDIQIGELKKTIEWNEDQIKSGIFKITINENIPEGVMPALIPVSAIAFVTQAGNGHAAMVSLEKIQLKYSNPQMVGTK